MHPLMWLLIYFRGKLLMQLCYSLDFCNFKRVTLFVNRWFLLNLMVKNNDHIIKTLEISDLRALTLSGLHSFLLLLLSLSLSLKHKWLPSTNISLSRMQKWLPFTNRSLSHTLQSTSILNDITKFGSILELARKREKKNICNKWN